MPDVETLLDALERRGCRRTAPRRRLLAAIARRTAPFTAAELWAAVQAEEPGIEVRVNFGVFAGRHATPAEMDELAAALSDLLPAFAIVAEERHEFGGDVEAMLRQIVIEIPKVDAEVELLSERIVKRAESWAADCIAARSELGELSEP